MRHGLSELNEDLSTRRFARWVGVFVFGLALCAHLLYIGGKFGLNGPPATGGDEPDYDSLGWELSHGRGYQFNFDDPEFRAPYDAAAQVHPESYTLVRHRVGATAYRPPLLPWVIAGTDWVFGRQFWAVRVINSMCMAATCGLMAQCVYRLSGLMPALLGAFVFVVIDTRTRLYSRAILTEAMACLLVALLAIALVKSTRSRPLLGALVAGVLAGLGVLARNIFAVWLPGIALLVYLFGKRSSGSGARRRPLVPAAVFLATSFAVLLPWMVRNCLALGAFMPLGVQGLNELSAGYSDEAVANRGIWNNAAARGFFDPIKDPEKPSLERERAQANYSRERAMQWVLQNPAQALALAPLKVYQEFRPRSPSELMVFVFALVGMSLLIKRPEGWILTGLLLMNVVAVAATWSVEGRFLVPLLFVFHVLAAVGLWSVLVAVFDSRRTSEPPVEPSG